MYAQPWKLMRSAALHLTWNSMQGKDAADMERTLSSRDALGDCVDVLPGLMHACVEMLAVAHVKEEKLAISGLFLLIIEKHKISVFTINLDSTDVKLMRVQPCSCWYVEIY